MKLEEVWRNLIKFTSGKVCMETQQRFLVFAQKRELGLSIDDAYRATVNEKDLPLLPDFNDGS